MPFAQLDDGFYDHPDFVGLADEFVGVWVKGLAYCNRHLTDGKIPLAQVIKLCSSADPDAAVTHLVNRGLWAIDVDAIRVVNFLKHNRSKRATLAQRAAAKARKEAWKTGHAGTRAERVPRGAPERVPEASLEHDPLPLPSPSPFPSPDPPKAPPAERVGESKAERLERAYRAGIQSVTSRACGVAFDDADRRALALFALMAGRDGAALEADVSASAAAYRRARGDPAKAHFERGFRPSKWAEWRDSEAPTEPEYPPLPDDMARWDDPEYIRTHTAPRPGEP